VTEDRPGAGPEKVASADPAEASGGTRAGRAAIVVADRDAAEREMLSQELSKRYGADYQVVVCGDPAELDKRIRDLIAAGTPVALVIGGVGDTDPDGIEILA